MEDLALDSLRKYSSCIVTGRQGDGVGADSGGFIGLVVGS